MESSDQRRVEIAGGGLGGLSAAILFALCGWKVRVHERSDYIREVGAGIYLRNNLISVLEIMGVAEEVERHSLELTRSLYRDGNGSTLQDMKLGGSRRMWMTPRHVLIQALEGRAKSLGIEILLNSHAVDASSDGTLTLDTGECIEADLVIGADGSRSKVRDSLGLLRKRKELDSVATRFIVPGRTFTPEPWTVMYWSGNRRIGVAACGDDKTYVYLIGTKSDAAALRQPIDVDSWSASFPVLTKLLESIADQPSIQHPFTVVQTKSWRSGRAAIIGDAAHCLPPLLGQGAGLAISNAWSLAESLHSAETSRIPEALGQWEKQYRRYSDITQNWSMRLDMLTRLWPKPILPLRNKSLIGIGRSKFLQRRIRVAESMPISAFAAGTRNF